MLGTLDFTGSEHKGSLQFFSEHSFDASTVGKIICRDFLCKRNDKFFAWDISRLFTYFSLLFPALGSEPHIFCLLGFGESVVGGVGPFLYLETVLPLRSILQCEIQLNHIQSWHKTERDQCHSTVSCDPGTFWPEDTGSGHTPGTQKIKFNWNHFLKLCIHLWKIRPRSLTFDAIPTALAMFSVVGFMLDYYLGYPVARSGSLPIKSMPNTLITNSIAFVLDSKNLHP